MASSGLCDVEEDYLIRLASGESLSWGAALGQALEVLEGHGFVDRELGRWLVTDKGRVEVERLKAERAAGDATPRGISDSLDALDGQEV